MDNFTFGLSPRNLSSWPGLANSCWTWQEKWPLVKVFNIFCCTYLLCASQVVVDARRLESQRPLHHQPGVPFPEKGKSELETGQYRGPNTEDRDHMVVQQRTTSELDTGQDDSHSACKPHPPQSHPPTAFSPWEGVNSKSKSLKSTSSSLASLAIWVRVLLMTKTSGHCFRTSNSWNLKRRKKEKVNEEIILTSGHRCCR